MSARRRRRHASRPIRSADPLGAHAPQLEPLECRVMLSANLDGQADETSLSDTLLNLGFPPLGILEEHLGWQYVDRSRKFRSVSGVVQDDGSRVTYEDFPSTHDSHDQNTIIRVDEGQEGLVSVVNEGPADGNGNKRNIEIEWETGISPDETTGDGTAGSNGGPIFPKWVWPSPGDRVWANGSWIYDMGHPEDGKYKSEIHPPRAFATMRDEVVKLPNSGDTPVRVTAADVYVHGDGGYAPTVLEAGINTSLFGGWLVPYFQNPIDENFSFYVDLPPKPAADAQFTYFVEDGPGNTIGIAPVVEQVSDAQARVVIPLAGSGAQPLDTYARRIKVGWRSPDPGVQNLHHVRLTVESMQINDDRDPFLLGTGELSFFWVNVNKANGNNWIRLSDHADRDMNDLDDDDVVHFGDASFDFYDFTGPRARNTLIRAHGYEQDGFDSIFGDHEPILLQADEYLDSALHGGNNDPFGPLSVELTAGDYANRTFTFTVSNQPVDIDGDHYDGDMYRLTFRVELRDPVLAVNDHGALRLNMGPYAGDRVYENTTDGDEAFKIEHVSSQADGTETVTVSAFGFTQTFSGVKRIRGEGGLGTDVVTMGQGVASPSEFWSEFDPVAHPGHADGGADETLVGGDGPSTLHGGGGNDLLLAGDGPALVFGGGGRDTVRGGAADDTLYGEDGDDRIEGGLGRDLISGGNGDDSIDGGAGDDTLDGDDGADKMIGDDTVAGGLAGNDSMSGGAGNDTMAGDNAIIDDVTLLGGAGSDSMSGGDGDDLVYGQGGSDTLHGGASADTLYGGDGPDSVSGDAGDDLVVGDAGDDTAQGNDGDDSLFGNAGDDDLAGNDGNDDVIGGTGNDTMDGGAGNDAMLGDDGTIVRAGTVFNTDGTVRTAGRAISLGGGAGGNDSMLGGDGHDTMFGQAGNDTMRGGSGDDDMVGNGGSDSMSGDAGVDYLLGDDGSISTPLNAAPAAKPETAAILRTLAPASLTLGDADVMSGGDNDDVMLGQGGDDQISGDGGMDVIEGNAGADSIAGGAGDDDLIGGSSVAGTADGNDAVDGGSGNDGILGDNGMIVRQLEGNAFRRYTAGNKLGLQNNAVIRDVQTFEDGVGGADSLVGGTEDDTVHGQGGNDRTFGNDGNDDLYGELGADFMDGGAGDDGMVGDRGLIVGQLLDGSTAHLVATNDHKASEMVDTAGTRKRIVTLIDADNGGVDSMYGGLGDDSMHGGAADDVMYGDDAALAGGGDDAMFGDGGNDRQFGQAGADHLYGGYGDDDLDGGTGGDTIYGGDGKDTLRADVSADRLFDWFGNFNAFVVPGPGFGAPVIVRSPNPWVRQFMLDLAAGDGATDLLGETAVVEPPSPSNSGPGGRP